MMYTSISTFSQIILKPNSLLVLDIDETTLKFPFGGTYIDADWWKHHFDHYYSLNHDFDFADNKAYEKWLEHIHSVQPEFTDKKGLMDLLELANTMNIPVIFLTARPFSLANITITHFESLGIINKQIYYAGNIDKGTTLKNIILTQYSLVQNVIVIDDLDQNLSDIILQVGVSGNYDVQCNKFVMKR